MAYTYKRLEKKHLAAVQYLLKTVYKKKVSVDYLINKYSTAYLGLEFACSIAFHEDEPVAMYGAIPQKMCGPDGDFLAVFTCDSFTMPDHQRKGLHYDLARYAYDIMVKEGVKFVYAYHSENTWHSCKKLDWKDLSSMKRFHLKTGALPRVKVWNRFGFSEQVSKKAEKVFGEWEVSETGNPLKSTHAYYQDYSLDFQQYKNTYNRHFLIEIEGCTFHLKVDAIIHIGYFDFPDQEALLHALDQLKALGSKVGVNEILFQVHPGSRQFAGLSEVGEALPSWKVGYFNFDSEVDFDQLGYNYADFDTY